jgi:hypothetical protein
MNIHTQQEVHHSNLNSWLYNNKILLLLLLLLLLWLYSPSAGPWPLFQILIPIQSRQGPSNGVQSVMRPLPTQDIHASSGIRTHNPVLEHVKRVRPLDRSATMIGTIFEKKTYNFVRSPNYFPKLYWTVPLVYTRERLMTLLWLRLDTHNIFMSRFMSPLLLKDMPGNVWTSKKARALTGCREWQQCIRAIFAPPGS